jgi:hypothetical protein
MYGRITILGTGDNERLGILVWIPSLFGGSTTAMPILALPNSEHLGPTYGTYALSGRPAVLHDNVSGVLHFSLGAALHAVCLHLFTSLFVKG